MIVTVLALTTGACTIHRHYHSQAPGAHQGTETQHHAQPPEGPPGDYAQSADQPIAPDYARPAPTPRSYSQYEPTSRRSDRYNGYQRYERYEHRCDCDGQRQRRIRRPARRRAPGYPIHPGPVVPDNPVDWLE